MFISILKMTFANIWKNRLKSFILIFCFAFGFVGFILSSYWLRYETSYDEFYPESERIYRVYTRDKQTDKVYGTVPGILNEKIQEHFTEIESSTAYREGSINYKNENAEQLPIQVIYADSSFFSLFPQTVLSKNQIESFQNQKTIILTKSMAIRLFGNTENAIGQKLRDSFTPSAPSYTVTSVVENPPFDTNITFDAITICKNPKDSALIYIKTKPDANATLINKDLRNLIIQSEPNNTIEVGILPITDARYDLNPNVPFPLIFIKLITASFFILLITTIVIFAKSFLKLFRQRR